MKKSYLWLVASLLLTACGGGDSNSNAVQGNPSGNTKLLVTNQITQDFYRAKVQGSTSTQTLYEGQFSCPATRTCTLAIDVATEEPFSALFFNQDGDLVGAFNSAAKLQPVNRIIASESSFGAYLFKQQLSLSKVVDGSKVDAISHSVGIGDVFTRLAKINAFYTNASGLQAQEVISTNLANDVANGVDLAKVAGLAQVSTNTTLNCSGTFAPTVQTIGTVIEGLDKITDLGKLGSVAGGIATILGAVCDENNKKLDMILGELNTIESQLDALQMGQQSIENELAQVLNIDAKNIIYTNKGNIQTALNAVMKDVRNYDSVLNSVTPAATNLSDYFARTGGLDAKSLSDPNKAAIQKNAIGLLNSLSSQYDHFSALGLGSNYTGLALGLTQLCSTSKGLPIAEGDFIATRQLCNSMIVNFIAQIATYEKAANIMLNDEVTVIEAAKGSINFENPFGISLAASQADITNKSLNILNGPANLMPKPFVLFDGLSPRLMSNLADPSLNCSSTVNGVSYPSILEWYPAANKVSNPYGPYLITQCRKTADTGSRTLGKFFYTGVDNPTNVMGVLVPSDGGYLAGFPGLSGPTDVNLDQTYYFRHSSTSDKQMPTHFVDRIRSYTSPGIYGLNNAPTLCNGQKFCGIGITQTNPYGNYFMRPSATTADTYETNYAGNDSNTQVCRSTGTFSSECYRYPMYAAIKVLTGPNDKGQYISQIVYLRVFAYQPFGAFGSSGNEQYVYSFGCPAPNCKITDKGVQFMESQANKQPFNFELRSADGADWDITGY